ncbi:hypothetical protein [Thalassobacillus sp. B23F22_16]|uniref:hypothetical protein n=1 Tax=Thalassobacillus sp. B23F22_16 TaxID=3459513 RepID=UPI00373EE059
MKKINFSLILLVLTVILLGVATFNGIKKNDAEKAVVDEQNKVKQLQEENENLQNLSEDEKENTFDNDIEWFVTKVYTLENRKELYEEIKDSATEEVLTGLFGDELPPDENQGKVGSIDREVSNIDIFGKYKDDSHYKAIVTFDLKMGYEEQTETGFTVIEINLIKKDETWVIDEFEEYAKGGRK